jgi:hypothetical protein
LIGVFVGWAGLLRDDRDGNGASVFFDARRCLDLVHGREVAAVAGFTDWNAAAWLAWASELKETIGRNSSGSIGLVPNAHFLRVDGQRENRFRRFRVRHDLPLSLK